MDRRREQPAKKGAPAWMTTFGDLMALLLTFFVLMLSLSNINKEKYDAISEALGDSFGDYRINLPNTRATPGGEPSIIEAPIKLNGVRFREKRSVNDEIKEDFKTEITSGLLGMKVRKGELTVSFPENLAFAPGSAEITDNFAGLLNRLSKILSTVPGEIRVAGHTDNIAINSPRFETNWELSSSRAVAVVRALIETGKIKAERLSAVAYADTRPLVPNNSEELRARNRRVEIKLIQQE